MRLGVDSQAGGSEKKMTIEEESLIGTSHSSDGYELAISAPEETPAERSKKLSYQAKKTIAQTLAIDSGMMVLTLGLLGLNLGLNAPRMKGTWLVYLSHWHLLITVLFQGLLLKKSIMAWREAKTLNETTPKHPADTRYDLQHYKWKGMDYRQVAMTSSVVISGLSYVLLRDRHPAEIALHGASALGYFAHSLLHCLPYGAKQGTYVLGMFAVYCAFVSAYDLADGHTYSRDESVKDVGYVYQEVDWSENPVFALIYSLVGIASTMVFSFALSIIKNLCCWNNDHSTAHRAQDLMPRRDTLFSPGGAFVHEAMQSALSDTSSLCKVWHGA